MKRSSGRVVPSVLISMFLCTLLAGCGLLRTEDPERDEIIGGVRIPVPRGMNKSTEQRVELSLPGIEGGTASYQGSVDSKEIVAFYQAEMPRRGWVPKGSLVSQGGALAYTKDTRSALIRVSERGRVTVLDILVGAIPLQTPSPLQEKTIEPIK